MAFDTKNPYDELNRLAGEAGMPSSAYLQCLLAGEKPAKKRQSRAQSGFQITKDNEHLFGPVNWRRAKKMIEESLADLDAGKGIPSAQVWRNLEKFKKEYRKSKAAR